MEDLSEHQESSLYEVQLRENTYTESMPRGHSQAGQSEMKDERLSSKNAFGWSPVKRVAESFNKFLDNHPVRLAKSPQP